jgi:tripartite-type tricarboxylate transporter receptor subunit TctC
MMCRMLLAVLLAGGAVAAANAQDYPSKPVRVLTAFSPGGATDVAGRILCEHLTQALGHPFLIEGKPGAGGNIAGEALAQAAPDGHTLLIASMGAISVAKALYPNIGYDPSTDFAPISMLVKFPLVLEVSAKLGPKTLPEFLVYAKANPGKLNHGSPGIATAPHLVAELFMMRTGFKSTHVAYRGTGPMGQGMVQGEIQWAFDSPLIAQTLLKNGTTVVIGVGGAARDQRFPEVATLQEQGIPDSAWDTGFVLVAPAKTPRPIIDRIAAEVAKGYATPTARDRLTNVGLDPDPSTPEQAARVMAESRNRWSKVVVDANIKVE